MVFLVYHCVSDCRFTQDRSFVNTTVSRLHQVLLSSQKGVYFTPTFLRKMAQGYLPERQDLVYVQPGLRIQSSKGAKHSPHAYPPGGPKGKNDP